MKKYIGANLIKAKPMTRGEYNNFVKDACNSRLEKIAPAMDGELGIEGYIIAYPNKKNRFEGELIGEGDYVSWKTKDLFEHIYREIED